MYTVMVVDDEKLVRMAMRTLINWEAQGFRLAYEAENGKKALELLGRHPDIDVVITDINMPVMDGLALLRSIQTAGLSPVVIVMSVYDEFDLVRDAFTLGAKDYILKSRMESATVLDTLKQALSVAGIANSGEPGPGAAKEAKKHYLHYLMDHCGDPEAEEAAGNYRLGFSSDGYVVCSLILDQVDSAEEEPDEECQALYLYQVEKAVQQALEQNLQGEYISLPPREVLLIVSPVERGQELLEDFLHAVQFSVSNYFNISLTIGVSDLVRGIPQLNAARLQADRRAGLRFFLGKGRIITKDIDAGEDRERASRFRQLLKEFSDSLELRAARQDNEELTRRFDGLLSHLHTGSGGEFVQNPMQPYRKIASVILSHAAEQGLPQDDSALLWEQADELMARLDSREDTEQALRELLRNVTKPVNSISEGGHHHLVRKAKQYIKSGYANELTLVMVSEHIGLSTCHFSALFSKYEGMTFSQYLAKTRMKQAQKLLRESILRVHEISGMVGYRNEAHFSRAFKKHTGYSPREYRFHAAQGDQGEEPEPPSAGARGMLPCGGILMRS